MPDALRIALCDDHPVVRAGLCRVLEEDPGIRVIGEAATADEAVELAARLKPDVFVLDLTLPGEGGISATRRVINASPATRVLILTIHEDTAYLREAFAAGALGYVLKKSANVELAIAVCTVAAGERYVHPALGARLLMYEESSPGSLTNLPQLSAREAEILRLLALGYTNLEIGRDLKLSTRTVETYRSSVQRKLGLRSRSELVRFAREAGLFE